MINPERGYPQKPKALRWRLILLIVLGHLVALYGLSRALAPQFTASVEERVAGAFIVTVTTPDDPPQPDTPPEPDEGAAGAAGEEAVAQPVTAPRAPITPSPSPLPRAASTGTASNSGARESGEGTGRDGEGQGTGSGASGQGQGSGIAERPSVRSGTLDVERDFPVPAGGRETRFGRSVTVVFTVGVDGTARNCSVRRSDVDAETTALVCPLVLRKIRFNPARDRSGNPVESSYGYRVEFRRR